MSQKHPRGFIRFQIFSFVCPGIKTFACLLALCCVSWQAIAGIHSAPVTVKAWQVPRVAQHNILGYRVFKTNVKGEAEPIPFQIDEMSPYQDYILDQGSLPNSKESNGVFDNQDELVFMGEDVGPAKAPEKWPLGRPNAVYELRISKGFSEVGAVYIGIYVADPPAVPRTSYVDFDINAAQISTSRYRYRFDKKNYLVVRGIDLVKGNNNEAKALVDSSTFYMKADLKYFLTLEVNHADINSKLEAYKTGPVRSIVRVAFTYTILNVDFELGMYTEVSFFSNTVSLPAVMYNPLDGSKSLNEGSGFYYGFAISENPQNIKIESNLPKYDINTASNFLNGKQSVPGMYWIGLTSSDYMMYMEISPSAQMRKTGNVSMLYQEPVAGQSIASRSPNKAAPLGKSPVNLGVYFDLSSFAEGQHTVGFRLFFENKVDNKILQDFKQLGQWSFKVERVPL